MTAELEPSNPPIVPASVIEEHREQIDSGTVIVADVRWALGGPASAATFRDEYADGHIPGAIFVDVDEDLSDHMRDGAGRHPMPDEDTFGETLSHLGITLDSTVLAYGTGDPAGAARFVLMLRISGVNASLIDGGLPAYQRLHPEIPLETGENHLPRTDFGFQPMTRLVSIDEVAHAIPTRGALLVDARARERFRGDSEPIDPRPGHIPGAVNVPYTSHLAEDGTFRSADEIRDAFAAAGATTERIAFNYCGSGVSAAVNVLAMDHAGFRHVYLFPGSYSQWSADPQRPVETGDSGEAGRV